MGLVFFDRDFPNYRQCWILSVNLIGGILCYIWNAPVWGHAWFVLLLVFLAQEFLSTDERILWMESQALRTASWSEFLQRFWTRNYIRYQSPFYTFFLSHYPFRLGQISLIGGCSLVGMLCLYQQRPEGFLLAGCPLFMILRRSPLHDTIAFCLTAIGVWLLRQDAGIGAIFLGLGILMKYYYVLLFPVWIWRFQVDALFILLIPAVYLLWASSQKFAQGQQRFLKMIAQKKRDLIISSKRPRTRWTSINWVISKWFGLWHRHYLGWMGIYLFPMLFDLSWARGIYLVAYLGCRFEPKYFLMIWCIP